MRLSKQPQIQFLSWLFLKSEHDLVNRRSEGRRLGPALSVSPYSNGIISTIVGIRSIYATASASDLQIARNSGAPPPHRLFAFESICLGQCILGREFNLNVLPSTIDTVRRKFVCISGQLHLGAKYKPGFRTRAHGKRRRSRPQIQSPSLFSNSTLCQYSSLNILPLSIS